MLYACFICMQFVSVPMSAAAATASTSPPSTLLTTIPSTVLSQFTDFNSNGRTSLTTIPSTVDDKWVVIFWEPIYPPNTSSFVRKELCFVVPSSKVSEDDINILDNFYAYKSGDIKAADVKITQVIDKWAPYITNSVQVHINKIDHLYRFGSGGLPMPPNVAKKLGIKLPKQK